ncbi:MAG: DUF5615 family PIN-like protein [Phycisphaerae bacterium]
MNLSPLWAGVLSAHGWEAVHWSSVGDPRASDKVVMSWAAANGHVVLTHDLDFGAILAATGAREPSCDTGPDAGRLARSPRPYPCACT